MSVSPLFSVVPTALDEQSPSVRTLNIMWDQYFHAQLIDQKEFDIITVFDKKDRQLQTQLLEQNGHNMLLAFLSVLNKIAKDEPIKYLLTLIDDILTASTANAAYLNDASGVDPSLPFGPLMRCLEREDEYINQKASKIIATLLTSGGQMPQPQLDAYFSFICERLGTKKEAHIDTAVQALQVLLLADTYRTKFFETQGAVARLIDVLTFKQNSYQTQYQVIFCIWLLSFSAKVAATLNQWRAVSILIDIIKASLKEKVIRVSLATLRNLIEKAPAANIGVMTDNKFLSVCQTLNARKWADEDIKADVEFLLGVMQRNVQILSSFEEYAAEVRSGHLEWSPVHRSDQFWKMNAANFNENDYEIVRALGKLLNLSQDPVVLAVACHDIGEYVRAVPRGKKILQEIGAKQRVMELMSDNDANVRYEALLAVQKYMVGNWEYLGVAAKS